MAKLTKVNKFDNFNKENLTALRSEIQSALDVVAKKLGLLEIKMGTITYGPCDCSSTIKCKTVNQEGSTSAKIFEVTFGKNLISETFKHGANTFTVKEFNSRKRKFPVICTRDDGASVGFPIETIKLILKIK
jgi:hypothetical protein